jgi:hypothetical protein
MNSETEFWSRVQIGGPDECWPWLGGCSSNRYGIVWFKGIHISAHRLAWKFNRRRTPGRWHIRHRCDNPPCCNPKHLFRGTQTQNLREASKRGRMSENHRGPNPTIQGVLNGQAKLTEAKVRWARRKHGVLTISAMCKHLGITRGTLHPALTGKTWRHVQ